MEGSQLKQRTLFSAADVKAIFRSWLTARVRICPLPELALDEVVVCTSDAFHKVLGIVAAIKLYDSQPRLVLPAREQEAYQQVIGLVSQSDSTFDKGTLRGKTLAEAVALLVDYAQAEEASVRKFA